MSFNNTDTTSGREGLGDERGGVGSYGQGTGSGAYDPANTGLGGYGASQTQHRAFESADQQFQTPGEFDDSPNVPQTQGSTQRAFGGDRGTEKPRFSGSDTQYSNTTAGSTFAQRPSSGVGQGDDFDDDNSTGNIPGTRSSGAASGGQYDNASDDVRGRNQFSDVQQGGGFNDDQYGGESQRERGGGNPTLGDKMRGNAEKLAGSIMGKKDMKERGQERKNGEF